MLKRLMAALLLSQLALFIGCGGRTGSRPTIEESSKKPEMRSAPTAETSILPSPSDGLAPGEGSLVFEIVEQNRVKKGGSLDPLLVPEYVLFVVKAVLREAPQELTEPKVRTVLQTLLSEVRSGARQRGEQIDGVSAFLYQSRDHVVGGSPALGRTEWWPKGHSFSRDNVTNIKNKATYVEEIDVFLLPKTAEIVVQRLSEDQRRAVFTELVRTQDRAMREAEAKYPTDASKIPISKLSTYDFKGAIEKNMETEEKLRVEYERELLRRFAITKEELDDIKKEAMGEQWPLPSR